LFSKPLKLPTWQTIRPKSKVSLVRNGASALLTSAAWPTIPIAFAPLRRSRLLSRGPQAFELRVVIEPFEYSVPGSSVFLIASTLRFECFVRAAAVAPSASAQEVASRRTSTVLGR
jgi:hypothetical protein